MDQKADLEAPLTETGDSSVLRDSPGLATTSGESSVQSTAEWLFWQVFRVIVGVPSWYVLLVIQYYFFEYLWISFGVFVALAVLWRVILITTAKSDDAVSIPYTCGTVSVADTTVIFVATVHISPRAPRDVRVVIDSTSADLVLIELDEERLDRLRDTEPERPKDEGMQPIKLFFGDANAEHTSVLTQRSLWNAEWTGNNITGDVVFDAENAHCALPSSEAVDGRIALVHRGGPSGQPSVTFAMKAFNAARGGAKAVLVVNGAQDVIPQTPIGNGSLKNELKLLFRTCSCGFPPVPVLLVPHAEGTQAIEACKKHRQEGSATPRVEFEVVPDKYPRRTLRRRLCQTVALMGSGIGILYGVIECFYVQVGAEFTVADETAKAKGIPCACIDVDMNDFWSRIGWALMPTPVNILKSILDWMSFPRLLFRFFFPARGQVDVLGGTFLHAFSFPLKHWIAFVIAGFCSSFVMSHIVQFLCSSATSAAQEAGAFSHQDHSVVQTYLLLAIEAYAAPRIYDGIVAARDEAMYQGLVARSREHAAKRVVVVVGAGHSNGMMQKVRDRGL
eukprot:TRINITY_DN34886_c0_g3_i1.p1 TRINITY_DN34886_c0_g3~~TRINITY_DN34886_c0_g3_i1.p1  ORF type:complete len:562 (-),score=101.93 TRINITY_DN34886_c0_g3_i1:263-1948(-)